MINARKKFKNFCFIMASDLNIDGKERKLIFKKFMQSVGGYHWIPSYPSYEHTHWKTKSYLDQWQRKRREKRMKRKKRRGMKLNLHIEKR